MPRVRRTELPDGFFHVTARGVDGCDIVRDDVDRVAFLRLFSATVARHGWRVEAFCLMDNHYHLVVESSRAALSAGIQLLSGRHAQAFNRRHERTGHLFGARFAARVIDSDERLENTIEYVLANPVRAGLCDRPEDWPWSGRARPATSPPRESEQVFVRPES